MGSCCPNSSESKYNSTASGEIDKEDFLQWRQGNIIKTGSQCIVYECCDMINDTVYAVKYTQNQNSQKDLKKQGKFVSALCHPHLLQYKAIQTVPLNRGTYVITEYAAGLSIKDCLDGTTGIQESLVLSYTQQLLEGLKYLHRLGYVHGNIKCSSLLISQDKRLKLGKLEGCFETNNQHPNATRSPYWLAPEAARGECYTVDSDIWAVGCTVIEMLTALPPWNKVPDDQVFPFLAQATEPPPIPEGLSEDCQTLLSYCLRINPKTRASAKGLLRLNCFTASQV